MLLHEAEEQIIICFYQEKGIPQPYSNFKAATGQLAMKATLSLMEKGRIYRRKDGFYVMTEAIRRSDMDDRIVTPRKKSWYSGNRKPKAKAKAKVKPKPKPESKPKPKPKAKPKPKLVATPTAKKTSPLTEEEKVKRGNGFVDPIKRGNRGADRHYSLTLRILDQGRATAQSLGLESSDFMTLQRLIDEGIVYRIPRVRPSQYTTNEQSLELAKSLDKALQKTKKAA